MSVTKRRSVVSTTGLNEVAEDVFRLGNRLFNWYLIRDQGRFTLVDAGLPAYWSQLEEALAALGGGISSVDGVVITHAHLDHVGMAARVSRLAKAPIYMHVDEIGRARWGGAQIPPAGLMTHFWRRGAFRILSTAVMGNVFFGKSIGGSLGIEGGDVLSVPGEPKVLFTQIGRASCRERVCMFV